MKRVSIIVLLTQSQQRLLLCAYNWYILKVRPKLKHKQASGKILDYSLFPISFPYHGNPSLFYLPHRILISTPQPLLSGGERLKALGSSHQSLLLSYLSFSHRFT